MKSKEIYCTEEQTRRALDLGAPINATFADIPNKCEYDGCYIEIPTAVQMLGWLEEQKDIPNINIISSVYNRDWKYEINLNMPEGYDYLLWKDGYTSRKEATIAAIDAALEYLVKTKEE